MPAIAVTETVSAAYILMSLISHCLIGDNSKSMKRIKILYVLTLFCSLTDAMSYVFDVTMVGYGLYYVITLISYGTSNIVLAAFMFYCEAYLSEKTHFKKWTFRAPMLILIFNAVLEVIWFVNGKIVSFNDGTFVITGTVPVFVLVTDILLLFYAAFIAFVKRKDVGIRKVALLAAYSIPIIIAIIVFAQTGKDFTVVASAISIVFVVTILQNEITKSKTEAVAAHDALAENNARVLALEDEFESLYDVELETGNYEVYIKGQSFGEDVDSRMVNSNSFFEDTIKNIETVVYRADRANVARVLNVPYIRYTLEKDNHIDLHYRLISGEKIQWVRLRILYKDDTKSNVIVGVFNAEAEMAAKKAEEELKEEKQRRLIDNITSSYSIVYIVDMSKDSVDICRMDDNMAEKGEIFTSFTRVKDYTVNSVIHPRDRERMQNELDFSVMRKKLAKAPTYSVEYCVLKNGATVWSRLNVTAFEEDKVIIGMTEADLKIAKKRLEEKKYDEYFALFIADVDTGMVKPLKTSPLFETVKVGEAVPYEPSIGNFAEAHEEDETRKFFTRIANLDYIRKELATEDKRTFSYKSKRLAKDKWIDFTSYVIERNADGSPAVFTLGFSLVDALATARQEIQRRMKADMQMIGGLANRYETLYYVDINEGEYKIYSLGGERFAEAKAFAVEGAEPFAVLQNYGQSELIHPEDRKAFAAINKKTVRERLAHSKKFSVRFRRDFDGIYKWGEMDVIKYEDIDEPANAIAVGFADRDAEIRGEQALNACFGVLTKEVNPVEAIDELMQVACEFYGAERCCVFEYDESHKTISNTFEWCAEGVESINSRLQHISSKDISRWLKDYSRNGEQYIDMTDDGPDVSRCKTGNLLKAQGVDSLIAVPIMNGEITVGFLGVDNPTVAQDNRDILKTVAVVAYSEILRQKQTQMAMYQSAKMFSDTFLNSYVSAYYINLTDCSQQVFRRDGYIQENYGYIENYLESINKYIAECVHPEDRDAMYEAVQPGYIKERLKEEAGFAVYMRDISGKEMRWYRFGVTRGSDEEHAGLAFSDVTQKLRADKENAEKLEKALSRAEAANRAKTTFLNNMSHDIRTPMNAIIGFTGLASKHIDNKEQVMDYLAKIDQSSNHLLSLINDVLDMSRIESGKMKLDEKEESMPEVIHTLRNIVQADIHKKQHEFFIDTVNVTDEDVYCDKLRLNQVLLNILSNSIKYTPAGGTISMRVTEKPSVTEGRATYEFRIKDNGMGMDAEYIKTIFDPFTRVNSSTVSGIQGTGLGMAITKSIIDMMGGNIEINSAPGKGTEVIVTFDFRLQGERRESIEMPGLSGFKALVVDDDSNNVLSLQTMLKDAGMRAECCSCGKEAIFKAESSLKDGNTIDVYFVDLLMPDMNGIETAKKIRSFVGNDVPIIIMTAYDMSETETEAKDAGITAFVSKPMFPSDLHRVLEKCFGRAADLSAGTEAFDFTGKKVLLVEDNEMNREIATEILEESGFVVSTADDGTVAVEKMKNALAGDYDLILMDVQMPVMDGYEATRQIRALGTDISKIPIIAMTANAFEEDRKTAIEAGMNEHVAKPIDIRKLKETLSQFLR